MKKILEKFEKAMRARGCHVWYSGDGYHIHAAVYSKNHNGYTQWTLDGLHPLSIQVEPWNCDWFLKYSIPNGMV